MDFKQMALIKPGTMSESYLYYIQNTDYSSTTHSCDKYFNWLFIKLVPIYISAHDVWEHLSPSSLPTLQDVIYFHFTIYLKIIIFTMNFIASEMRFYLHFNA